MHNGSEHTSELIVNYCSSELSIFTSHKDTEEYNEKAGLEEWRKLNSNPPTKFSSVCEGT
jgi:hypothetical protein